MGKHQACVVVAPGIDANNAARNSGSASQVDQRLRRGAKKSFRTAYQPKIEAEHYEEGASHL